MNILFVCCMLINLIISTSAETKYVFVREVK